MFFIETDYGKQYFSWNIIGIDALVGLAATGVLVWSAFKHRTALRTFLLASLIFLAIDLNSSLVYGGLPLYYAGRCYLGPCAATEWLRLAVDACVALVLIALVLRYIRTPRQHATGIAITLLVWATVTPWSEWYYRTGLSDGVGFPFGFYWGSPGWSFPADVTLMAAVALLVDLKAKAAFSEPKRRQEGYENPVTD